MSILGCGIDSVDISRINRMMALYPKRFLHRVFTQGERDQSKGCTAFYAKRFAAKEAFLKAVGLGLRMGLSWQDMSVSSNALGQPMMTVSPRGLDIIKIHRNLHFQEHRVHLSLSDTKHMAQAMVIFEYFSPCTQGTH